MLIGLLFAIGAALAAAGLAWAQARRAHIANARLVDLRRALADTSARLDSFIDNLPAAAVITDVDCVYQLANPVYCRRAGLTADEIIGRSARDIFPVETARRLEDLNRQVLATGEVVQDQIELPVAGDVAVRSLLKFPIRDADNGVTIGIGSLSTDLSEQREAERRLAHAQRMETVGQLSGGMAHDFNNLLMVIRGNLDLLREDFANDTGAAAKITRALKGVDRGAEIIQRLLSFARQQYLAPVPTRVDSLLEQTRVLLERTLRENIELRVDAAPDLPPVLVDPGQFQSALINLALNAQDAMEDGGVLTFSVHTDQPKNAKPRHLCIRVSDTGTGIAAELLDRVVEPFFTTKLVGNGSGLGLSMVYGFAKQTGGEMTIDSTLGRGTEVTLLLPVTHRSSAIETDDGEVIRGSATVLVVEDEPDVRTVAEELLSQLGCNVICTEHGEEALKVLESSVPLDLLFTDMVLPGGISGRTLIEIARMLRPETRVLATSGYAMETIERDGSLPVGVVLLLKPYSMQALSSAVERALAPPSISLHDGLSSDDSPNRAVAG